MALRRYACQIVGPTKFRLQLVVMSTRVPFFATFSSTGFALILMLMMLMYVRLVWCATQGDRALEVSDPACGSVSDSGLGSSAVGFSAIGS